MAYLGNMHSNQAPAFRPPWPWLALQALFLLACLRAPVPQPVGPSAPVDNIDVTLPPAPSLPARSPSADEPSRGGTITFQEIGAPGWYPSRRDPAAGVCDAYRQGECCLARHEPSGRLAPWDEELIMTLRGPMLLKQIVVYQPVATDSSRWSRVSLWDAAIAAPEGIGFQGDGVGAGGFQGAVGNKCLVDVSTDKPFPCGPGSVPYCPSNTVTPKFGWDGSKLIILQASMPRFGSAALSGVRHCSADAADNWYDAPWIGLSHGELIRSGKFGNCHCYSKDPAKWWLADGCGQFNAFEVVNDNNEFSNFGLFSTNLFAYHGYVGEGPCGKACDLASLGADADLIDKSTSRAAQAGALATPTKVPGVAFRRPEQGFRYFLVLLDSRTRTIQMAMIHPANLPVKAQSVLSSLPSQVQRADIEGILSLSLPGPVSTGLRRP